ncbi:MAG TPA: 50S ribosomal protein L25, partial [Bacteroidia bacterium]|nr:50S ribosomal protein L25 [Bacteroidia bacterium]
MQKHSITTQKRESTGKGSVKKYRNQGLIPCIVYDSKAKCKSILVNEKEFNQLFANIGEHTLITLDVDGKQDDVLVKDYQEHPVTERILHIDFYKVDPNKKIKTRIPIHSKGLPVGVRTGGILEHYLHSLYIECLPKDIPHQIEVEVSSLELNQGIYVRDLKLGDKIKIHTPEDQAIFIVHTPRVIVEEAPAEAKAEAEATATE